MTEASRIPPSDCLKVGTHKLRLKKGALVEAKVGKGHWIYVGLGLWRQLSAGTDGAWVYLTVRS